MHKATQTVEPYKPVSGNCQVIQLLLNVVSYTRNGGRTATVTTLLECESQDKHPNKYTAHHARMLQHDSQSDSQRPARGIDDALQTRAWRIERMASWHHNG